LGLSGLCRGDNGILVEMLDLAYLSTLRWSWDILAKDFSEN